LTLTWCWGFSLSLSADPMRNWPAGKLTIFSVIPLGRFSINEVLLSRGVSGWADLDAIIQSDGEEGVLLSRGVSGWGRGGIGESPTTEVLKFPTLSITWLLMRWMAVSSSISSSGISTSVHCHPSCSARSSAIAKRPRFSSLVTRKLSKLADRFSFLRKDTADSELRMFWTRDSTSLTLRESSPSMVATWSIKPWNCPIIGFRYCSRLMATLAISIASFSRLSNSSCNWYTCLYPFNSPIIFEKTRFCVSWSSANFWILSLIRSIFLSMSKLARPTRITVRKICCFCSLRVSRSSAEPMLFSKDWRFRSVSANFWHLTATASLISSVSDWKNRRYSSLWSVRNLINWL